MSERLQSDEVLHLYSEMQRIRVFETRVIELFRKGEFAGFLHTGIGQEGVAAGVCAQLRGTDYITATHRSHGHLLAKGVPMGSLLAEIYGKSNGLCGGVAGHVHVTDMARGVVGGNGVLGQNQPIATGLALGLQLAGRDDVVVSFFGDGTANEGAVHEAMNLAAVWSLPVLFLCERNDYAELTPITAHMRTHSLAERAQSYGFAGVSVDGTDIEAVRATVADALARLRRGAGPMLIEARVVRWHGHYEGDPQHYRADKRGSQDPLDVLAERYPDILTPAERERMQGAAQAEMDDAVAMARAGAVPAPEQVFRNGVYFDKGAA